MSDLIARLVLLPAGVALVAAVATDAVSTLVTTQRRASRLWPIYVFYRRTWRVWRALGRRIAAERGRERFLAVYGPLSLLGLLVVWVLLLLAGWGLVWWVLREQLEGVSGYLDAVYFAGVGFFTVGFGDVVPVGDLARLLALAQAFMGLVTIALVIGYLPTLFGAYSRREVQLLTLDDLSDERTTSTGLVESWHAGGGLDGLAAAFADWKRWCAEVFDSHTAYPMLAFFRSRQPGQHWLTTVCRCTPTTGPSRISSGCAPTTSPTCAPRSRCFWSRPSSATTPRRCRCGSGNWVAGRTAAHGCRRRRRWLVVHASRKPGKQSAVQCRAPPAAARGRVPESPDQGEDGSPRRGPG